MRSKIFSIILIVSLAVLLTGCQCNHEWNEATCASPKTCVKCEKSEGEALGHSWIAATHEAPEICTRCLDTRGIPMGYAHTNKLDATFLSNQFSVYECNHQWIEATCTSPSICNKCQETRGVPLGHTIDSMPDAVFAKTYMGWSVNVSGSNLLERCCVRCKTAIDSHPISYSLNATADITKNSVFTFSPQEFLDHINSLYYPGTVNFYVNDYSTGGSLVSIAEYDHPMITANTSTDDIIAIAPSVHFLGQGGKILSASQYNNKNCTGIVLTLKNEIDAPVQCNSLSIDTIKYCTALDDFAALYLLHDLTVWGWEYYDRDVITFSNLEISLIWDSEMNCYLLQLIPKK